MAFITPHHQMQLMQTGIGLRTPHVHELLSTRHGRSPIVDWLEVHAENYMGGGAAVSLIERLRETYPISLHGVGLSLGSADGVDMLHLRKLRTLCSRLQPILVSEHLSWSVNNGRYYNDLLPLPYTKDTLDIVCRNIDAAQNALAWQILIENPSLYLRYHISEIPEYEFLGEVSRRTGCAILCDVNNIFVSAHNTGFDAQKYIEGLPAAAVQEIHLAGHFRSDADGQDILIDDHGSEVIPPVWALYAQAIKRFGPIPTLIEWDNNLPPLDRLIAQARMAGSLADVALEG